MIQGQFYKIIDKTIPQKVEIIKKTGFPSIEKNNVPVTEYEYIPFIPKKLREEIIGGYVSTTHKKIAESILDYFDNSYCGQLSGNLEKFINKIEQCEDYSEGIKKEFNLIKEVKDESYPIVKEYNSVEDKNCNVKIKQYLSDLVLITTGKENLSSIQEIAYINYKIIPNETAKDEMYRSLNGTNQNKPEFVKLYNAISVLTYHKFLEILVYVFKTI